MGKLRMKRTPEEQAAHDLKKAKKAARKFAKRTAKHAGLDDVEIDRAGHDEKRQRTDWDDEDEFEPAGPSRAHKPDYDYIQAEVEEARFRDKMWGALDDDERLDSVEAKLNSFAHVPRRWRSGGMERMDEDAAIDPHFMEEEDYAEWVRLGMWRKKHAAEHAEQVRKQAEHAARLAREEAVREETRRQEKQTEEERKRKRKEKEHRRWADARELYETRWKELLGPAVAEGSEGPEKPLRFMDVPWPIFLHDTSVTLDGDHFDQEIITAEAIATFLLPAERFAHRPQDATLKKERRERLRETMLRFHPDKFEGRILGRVNEKDREKTKEAVAKVAVALNTLLAAVD